MKLPPLRRSRRWRWLLAGGILVLVAVVFVLLQPPVVSPVEKQVRGFLALPGNELDYRGFAADLGTNAIPFLVAAATRSNSAFRKKLLDYERKLAPVLPQKTLWRMLYATDASRDNNTAMWALHELSGRPDAAAAFVPYLKHPWDGLRQMAASSLRHSAAAGNHDSFCLLTNALSEEADEVVRYHMAGCILTVDPTNICSLTVLRSAQTSTNRTIQLIMRGHSLVSGTNQ